MKFSFDINGIGKEVSYVKEETSAITGVESLIDSNIYGAEMTDANAEFNAINVDMTIAINGFEASGNKDNAAAKPGFLKRTWEAIKALFRALGKYIMAAVNWVKKKFKKDKVDKQTKEASTIYEDVSKMCDEVRKENPNATEEEFAKKAKAKVDEKYGFGYGPEAVDIKHGNMYFATSIANIIKAKARLPNAHDASGDRVEVEVVLPIEDDRVAAPLIEKYAKIYNEAARLSKENPEMTMANFKRNMLYICICIFNGLQLVKLTKNTDGNEVELIDKLDGSNVDRIESEFESLTKSMRDGNPIVLHKVKLSLVAKDLNDKNTIEKAIMDLPQHKLSKEFYNHIYDLIGFTEDIARDINDKDTKEMDEIIAKAQASGEQVDVGGFKEAIRSMQELAKAFIKSVSREELIEASKASTPTPR
jgi:hypothetical protein